MRAHAKRDQPARRCRLHGSDPPGAAGSRERFFRGPYEAILAQPTDYQRPCFAARITHAPKRGQSHSCVANMYRADFVAEVVPGLVLVAATYIAAVPAFRTVRQSNRGRARGAMAWLSGFLFGLVATTLLSVAIEEAADPDASVAGFGLFGAFLGPFIGILHGKWLGPHKKRRRPPELGEGLPR